MSLVSPEPRAPGFFFGFEGNLVGVSGVNVTFFKPYVCLYTLHLKNITLPSCHSPSFASKLRAEQPTRLSSEGGKTVGIVLKDMERGFFGGGQLCPRNFPLSDGSATTEHLSQQREAPTKGEKTLGACGLEENEIAYSGFWADIRTTDPKPRRLTTGLSSPASRSRIFSSAGVSKVWVESLRYW